MAKKNSAVKNETIPMAVKDLPLYQEYYVQTRKSDNSVGSAIIMRGIEGLNRLEKINVSRDKVYKPINIDMNKILLVRLATEEDFRNFSRK